MHISSKYTSDTKAELEIAVDESSLNDLKKIVVTRLSANVRLPGFREGKAPANLVEKNLDQSQLQAEFLDEAINKFYVEAVDKEKLKPVGQPEVSITKFAPFNILEFKVSVDVVGKMKLPDYKKIKLDKKPVTVSAKDVNEVLDQLKIRAADKKEVKRASKDGDEVWIDFTGVDAKTKEPINGADGKDYPLVLGSNTFIPGFEPELINLKAEESKTFTITFPADYGVAALQNREVTFTVTVKKVNEVVEPKLDDKFAAQVGPFKSVVELKEDIKKQLTNERQAEAERDYENELINEIASKTTVAIPETLIDQQLDAMENDERQNLAYRGQTWQEHLEAEGVTEQEHREKNRKSAEDRIKAGLVLGEIAEQEKIQVTPEELEIRMQLLKGQYKDPQMQAELDKPENRSDILGRMLTEKTIDMLKKYVAA